MKTRIKIIYFIIAFLPTVFTGCSNQGIEGPAGADGQNATVYYSEWFSPSAWSGTSGDWYFDASAPDLTASIVESGVIMAYVWLAGDFYDATTIRPLPAYAVGANWNFLIHQYGNIEFTSDMILKPLTTGNSFRFVAIPGTLLTLKSTSAKSIDKEELKNMSYKEVCKLFNIPE